MKSLDYRKQFSKDLKKLVSQGKVDLKLLGNLLDDIANGIPLDKKYRDHPLAKHSQKEYQGCRDFHYKSNICIIYKITPTMVELIRIGSHQDLGLTENYFPLYTIKNIL